MATALYTAPVRPSAEILALAAELEDVEGLGHKATLVIAEQMHGELLSYADGWNSHSKAQEQAHGAPSACPQCGARIIGVQSYIGGRGYVWFDICEGDGSHYSKPAA